jgi:RNA-directed DNA polymerase
MDQQAQVGGRERDRASLNCDSRCLIHVDRFRAKLREVKTELRLRWHQPMRQQGKYLRAVVQGFFNYHAVPTNFPALRAFRWGVSWHWLRALKRRSQKGIKLKRYYRLGSRWLPRARIQHPWPEKRFDVRTRGKSRVR